MSDLRGFGAQTITRTVTDFNTAMLCAAALDHPRHMRPSHALRGCIRRPDIRKRNTIL